MYLGLDLGTSGLKGLLVSHDGTPVGEASAHYGVQQPHAGWSEQDPKVWVDALSQVLKNLRIDHAAEFAALRGLSFSGQMHGAVCLDDTGTPLRPCILWNDTRSAQQAAELDRMQGQRDISGNITFPGFTAPKLRWMQDNEPDLFAMVHKVLLPKDYLSFHLTGRYVTDMSDAAGTSWLDVGARRWSKALLAAGNMRLDQMPDLVEGCDVIGTPLPQICAEYGLSPTVQVVAGGADNAVAACGTGTVSQGQGFVSLGTSGVLLAARDSYAPDAATAVHTFCHAIPDRWYQMGVILSATDSMNWLARTLNSTPEQLAELVVRDISGPSHITFLPYLSGERTPHNDADIGGAFIGLRAHSTPADMTQAVMEGVGYALRDCLNALRKTGADLEQLLAIGGGTKSAFWLNSIATILNLDLVLPDKGGFGGALGAARLAMLADGADIKSALARPKIQETIKPTDALISAYDTGYQRFAKLYPSIKEL
ncbi:xylulokinase [Amylibacter marinus]|uniref:Xylulose kinase n=1 Tax=Amylibacter marinus TaxID=1475483 RepID=A0ABQ5VWK2_9RHOB|nr:xylulokinase [Amylibacter marinus]GLQ35473.1 xylulokinase [Amylibacter marinus]